MSMSTNSTIPRHYGRSSSSILSSDSDIRFTRKKLSNQYRCGCCIIATFLLFLLIATASLYIAYFYILPALPTEQAFRGSFRIVNGDSFASELADPSTSKFQSRSRKYSERLNLLFRRSALRHGFLGVEILALDGIEDKDLIVHFNIVLDPSYVTADADDVESLLRNEVSPQNDSMFFKNLTVDQDSIEVHLVNGVPDAKPTVPAIAIALSTSTAIPKQKQVCASHQLSYCKRLGYNSTVYPNVLGHSNIEEVLKDIISFREVVDGECHRYAFEFVCRILQPPCKMNPLNGEISMHLPCRSFCRDFMQNCGSRLAARFKYAIDCGKFPELISDSSCAIKPGCVTTLQANALSPLLCDGVIDCEDLSDETSCAYCAKNYLHCGSGRMCIHQSRRCDGRKDCSDGSDERNCLSLAISTNTSTNLGVPHPAAYQSKGYVVFKEKGESGMLCGENLDHETTNSTIKMADIVAASLCKSLTYENVLDVEIVQEPKSNTNMSYVKVKETASSEISFVRASCLSHSVLKVTCSKLQCGIRIEGDSVGKMAASTDWPWHAALFKYGIHSCDGVLIASNWILTSSYCFQGQPKAEWMARLGITRITSTSPWQQERRIVGMIKSPVEGSTVTIIKLDEEVVFNDFVRPACLSQHKMDFTTAECNTLGWTKNRQQLQRVQLKKAPMEKCENISLSTINSLCMEPYYEVNDCNEEEAAGSSVVCRQSSADSWVIIGIVNWKITCYKNVIERPRLYDVIASNVNWIHDTIKDH